MAQHIMVDKLTRANFMDVIKPHYALLQQTALKYCHYDEALADDVLQETMLKAYSNLDKFRGGNLGGWIYRILHNTIISYFRKRHGEVNFDYKDMSDVNGNATGETGDLSSRFDALATHDQEHDFYMGDIINKAMGTLPEQFQAAFKLAVVDGLSYNQVAKELKIPVGTVMSRIFRAKEALQKKLKPLLMDN